jgi:hypothetical protein
VVQASLAVAADDRPGLSVVVGSYTGYIAFTQPDALVVGDYYKQGKAINQDLRRDGRRNLAMDTRLSYDAAQARLSGSVHSFGKAYQAPLQLHAAHDAAGEGYQAAGAARCGRQFLGGPAMLERSRWRVLVENDKRDWRCPASGPGPCSAASRCTRTGNCLFAGIRAGRDGFQFRGLSISISRLLTRSQPSFLNFDRGG